MLAATVPDAPWRLPVVGHLPALLHDRLAFVTAASRVGPVAAVSLAGTDAFLINDPALVRRVLVDDVASFGKGIQYEKLRILLGESVSTSCGVAHRDRRRAMQPAFQRGMFDSYAALIRRETDRLVDRWRVGQEVLIDDEMRKLSLSIVTGAMCSAELDPAAIAVIQRDLPTVMRGVAWRALVSSPALERLPIPANRRFRAANARLRQIVMTMVQSRPPVRDDRRDLLGVLRTAGADSSGSRPSDDQLRDELVNVLFAGTETTGNALGWLWHALATHPEVGDRLRTESGSSGLEYAYRVARETLRLYPPPWLISRRTVRPVRVGAYAFPADVHILFSPYAIHRHPDNFPAAVSFDPDRWLPGRMVDGSRHSFLAFGAGPHNCIGEGFALLEIAIVATRIASRYRLTPRGKARGSALATLTPLRLRMVVEEV
ncbi:cytochrome P450 [Nocardia sp. NPDC057668]|uniref:cytochrome P450 n=1 Tax=Nocardia sp. NPDC057668 TaxID=3346202 RepID=UPI00366D2A9E